jgi:hypothetical protein
MRRDAKEKDGEPCSVRLQARACQSSSVTGSRECSKKSAIKHDLEIVYYALIFQQFYRKGDILIDKAAFVRYNSAVTKERG